MSFHAPNISKNLLEAVAAVLAEGAAGRALAANPKAKKDADDAGESTMTYRGKDEKGTYTVKKHRAKGASEYKEVGQRVYEDEQIDEGAAGRMLAGNKAAQKSANDSGESTMTYRGKDEKGTYTVKKHRAKGASEYKEVGQRVYEDVEQLDEVSDKLLHNYMRKADRASANWSYNERRAAAGDKDAAARAAKDQKRHAGIELAKKKLANKPNTPVKEDVEQIDEANDAARKFQAEQARAKKALARAVALVDKRFGFPAEVTADHVLDVREFADHAEELVDSVRKWANSKIRYEDLEVADLDQLNEGPDTKVDGLDALIKQSIEQFKKHYGKEWSKVLHASVDRLAEGAFSDMDIDRQEADADPKRKANYTKDFNELLAKHKGAGLDPSERKRLRRLAIILGKKLPGE